MHLSRVLLFGLFCGCNSLRLGAYVSSGGLHGEIKFESADNGGVKVTYDLQATLQYPEQQWSWSITQFPVDYTVVEGRCEENRLGKSIVDLTELVGYLELPANQTGSIEIPNLNLTGEKGLWGKGLLLREVYKTRTTCASIMVLDKNAEKVAEAKFFGPISGTVVFRWLGIKVGNATDTVIYTDLHSTVEDKKLSPVKDFRQHQWKILVTDIFDSTKPKTSCNFLQSVFDPDNAGEGKAIGDLNVRLGKVKVAVDPRRKFKDAFRDEASILPTTNYLGPKRHLYLVIFHPKHEDTFVACARIRQVTPMFAKSVLNFKGIKGSVIMYQEASFYPTWVNVSIMPINELETRLRYETKTAAYRIHELPEEPSKSLSSTGEQCTTTKKMYNPLKIDESAVPPPGLGTQDQYAIGDLSGKLQGRREGSQHLDILEGSAKLSGLYWDLYLPLSGPLSVIHRSLVLHKYNETDNKSVIPWICGTILLSKSHDSGQMRMSTAEVFFRYPLVGRIVFRQPRDEPDMDTTIIVEQLVHADGSSLNDTGDHRWMVHQHPPGKDYYDWQKRCLSAGEPFNPFKIVTENETNRCSWGEMSLCRMGDLTRHGNLNIAGKKLSSASWTRALFTDPFLPLTGPDSILAKSLLIYDDHGPVARGERLACATITSIHRRKAVAKDWFGNGEDVDVRGKLEFIQQSEYDATDIEVELDGLSKKMSGYHVHITPVEMDLEFPCEESSLYGHWNPLKVDPSTSPAPAQGTTDLYEMGDLSGKFGTLDNKNKYYSTHNDTMLPLFGPRSILGRSIVIHKKDKNLRWACSTIERGYAPSEARELRAIASFHHPDGFAYGYVRMTQLIHYDGTQSETVIEVNLRHPGKNDRNMTRNHNWAIYVNPVGVDATVKTTSTRCVAAGYVWNPYYTQLADPRNEDLYRQECGNDLPLRCYVGDVSARLGSIDLGAQRRVFTDSNFPLEGPVTAMGKSIVILDKEYGGIRYACANIEPDYDIVKYANIRKPPRFVVTQFLEDVRRTMGIPDWMLSIDSRKTKILHNGACIQFLLHFKGHIANQLEKDFSKLISSGRLDSPSLQIPGFIATKRKSTLVHRQCGSRDPNDKSSNFIFTGTSGSTSAILPSLFLCAMSLLTAVIL